MLNRVSRRLSGSVRVPSGGVVDRLEFVAAAASVRRVIHVGCADHGLIDLKTARQSWLHARLAECAQELVGVDLDADAVEQMRAAGYECVVGDCQRVGGLAGLGLRPAELVIAGELIEHLDNPGIFLDEIAQLVEPGGELLITTPNAARLSSLVAGAFGREICSPEHVAWHSWRTLTTLLRRHGWSPLAVHYYVPWTAVTTERVRHQAVRASRGLERAVYRMAPPLADGIIVTARRASPAPAASPRPTPPPASR